MLRQVRSGRVGLCPVLSGKEKTTLIQQMQELRDQWCHLGRVIAKETGLIRLVEWLNRKLK